VKKTVEVKKVDKESLSLSTNPEFKCIIEQARKEFRSGKKLSLEGMKKEVSQLDVTQDPTFQMEGHDSDRPGRFFSQPGQASLWQKET